MSTSAHGPDRSWPGSELQLIIDSTPALIHTARADGYHDFFNKTCLNYVGCSLEDLQGLNWMASIHPEDVQGMVNAWRASLASGEPFVYEARVRRADGQYRWMLHQKVAVRDEQQSIVKWYGTSIDIEDRKRAEEEVRRSDALAEERLRLVVDTTPAMINTCRPDGHLDYVNKGWLDYFGLSLETALDRADVLNMTVPSENDADGGSSQPIIHPEDLPGLRSHWEAILISGKPDEHEARARRFDGVYRWHLFRAVPLCDKAGRPLKWYVSGFDIEDLKRVEKELRNSEFYLGEGQRLAHMGSWAFHPTGFEYWSSELFRVYGLDPSGKPPTVEEYLDLVHPEDREFVMREIQKMLANNSAFEFTKRIVRPDGKIRRVRCVGIPTNSPGTDQRFVGTGLDVTEQQLLTEELERQRAHLTEAQKLTHTGSWAWRLPNPALDLSEEWYRIYGFDPAEGAPTLEEFCERVHPEDRLNWKNTTERAIADKADYEHEFRILLPNGIVKWIHTVGHPVLSETGGLEQFVGSSTDITERKSAEQALQRSEAYLAEAQRLSHTGSFGWKPDTGVIVWSDESYRIFEYDRSVKPTIDSVVQRVHPDDRAEVKKVINRALAGASDFEHAYRLLLPDGRVKHVHAIAHVLRDASGKREFVGAATDITERKTAEEALRNSEAYLAEAQRLSHTGSWAWSPDTDVRHWSEECYRVLGFDPRDGLPRTEELIERIHPDDQAVFRESAKRATDNKLDEEIDYRIVHPSGTVRDIHSIGHPVFGPYGDLIEYTGTVIDVTERKRAEEELRRSEMELRQMLDFTPQLVGVFGPNGERLYANRILLDYLGTTLDDWRQTPGDFFSSQSFIHPDDRERATRTYSDSARSAGSAYELELRVRKGDGSYRWFLARYNPVRDDKGQVMQWYAACTDIEDRKRAEDRLRSENVALREEIDKASMFEEIVGTSRALQTVLSRISKVASSNSTVLITGETGTGKELVARAIHRRSDRASRPFVSVNCAATPRDLIASELFGHEKGAFTGATQQRLGRFELANGGTLFLDEAGELPSETQVALLRVLQEHEFERVGGTRPIRADVRVIAATNRDLQAAISTGSFRSDLYYRLNVFPIEIPPLRERKEDIRLLVEYFIDRYARKAGKHITTVEKRTLQVLQSYPWPGNIRELQNVIERSVIVCETENFSVDESWLSRRSVASEPTGRLELSRKFAAEEKEMIEAALRESRGRVSGSSGAAAKLGIPGSTLESKIRSLKINKNHFKTNPSADRT